MTKLEHTDILELFEEDWKADENNRDQSYDDLRFLAGDQWDASARAEREAARRPMVTINRVGQFVRQVTGDMRLNPTSINVLPVDDEGDIEKAEIFEGLIRQIEYASGASQAYAHAFECSAGIGIGHFRINTRYAQDSVTDQEIFVERIINPLAVVWDSAAVQIDRSDALHCFVTELMPRRVFKKKYPKASESDFPHFEQGSGLFWRTDQSIRVAEFWHKEPYDRTLALMLDGSTVDITEVRKADRKFLPIQQERTFTDYRVKQYLISGSEILSGPNEWAGKHIPIVPAIGTEIPQDETIIRHGLIRWLKDPQRMYNYYRSSQAELIGQQPRAPYLVTPTMVAGFEAQWNTSNTSPRQWLPYNPDPKAPQGRPVREQPPEASPALWQEAQLANEDMKATTGIYDASLGAKSNETSGRAILARQREGDVGSFHYFDNFKAAIKRAGDILVDLIPHIYDAPRTIRIIGKEEAEPEYTQVNQPAFDTEHYVETVLNDLSVGRFDVRVTAGPSFSTQREEARESMIAATQANPALWQVAGDLIVKAMDWPGAKEISERLKRTIPPQITGDEEALAAQQPQPDPIQEAMGRLAMAAEEAKIKKDETAAMLNAAKAEQIGTETELAPVKLELDVEKAAHAHQHQDNTLLLSAAKAATDAEFRAAPPQQPQF